MDALTAIFGNDTKVKILRLFLFNPQAQLFLSEIARRTQSLPRLAKRELSVLERSGIIWKKRSISKEEVNSGKKVSIRRVKGIGYMLNNKFPHLEALKNLLSISSIPADEALAKRFVGLGRIRFLVAAGVFVQEWDARVDILIAGEELNLQRIETIIKALEAEIGKEIAYSAFETADFEYRFGIHDRLIRDILDYPHITLIDRLGIDAR